MPVETARDGFPVVLTRHVCRRRRASRDLVLKSIYQPAHNVTLVGTGNAPSRGSVTAARRTRARTQPEAAGATAAAASPRRRPPTDAERESDAGADPRRAAAPGWGGGSDQDALETYKRVGGAAR